MLDETAKEKGYALLCVSEPRSDCRIRVIDEVIYDASLTRFQAKALLINSHAINLQDEILGEVLCSSGNAG